MFEEFYQINGCTGIALQISRNGACRISACSVSRKKDQLEISRKLTEFHDIKQLPEYVAAKSIIALNLNGKGVLHKKTAKFETLTPEIFRGLLPDSDMADFYVQHFTSGSYSYVSLIRKTEADKWTGGLEKLGMQVVMLSLGPFPVSTIIKQLNVYGGDLLFD